MAGGRDASQSDFGGSSSGGFGGGGGGGGGQGYSSIPASTPRGGGQDMSTVPASPPSIGNEDDGRLDYLTGDYLDINLTPEQKEQFQDYQQGVSESISPSSKTSNKIISGLLSATVFPFAGNLYNKYIDATAMGYSIPNPFEGLFDGGSITPESIQNFQDKGGDEQQSLINNAVSQLPFAMTGTTPQDSMVNQYFANQPTSSLSSGLETSYNNAKSNINNILGIATPSQQFGYSQAPYGSYSSTNMAGNPYKDYLTTRGLI